MHHTAPAVTEADPILRIDARVGSGARPDKEEVAYGPKILYKRCHFYNKALDNRK